MTRIAALVVVALVAACATNTQPERFYRPGTSEEQQRRDEYQCELQVRSVASSFASLQEAQEFATRCMQSRGYMYGQFRGAR